MMHTISAEVNGVTFIFRTQQDGGLIWMQMQKGTKHSDWFALCTKGKYCSRDFMTGGNEIVLGHPDGLLDACESWIKQYSEAVGL